MYIVPSTCYVSWLEQFNWKEIMGEIDVVNGFCFLIILFFQAKTMSSTTVICEKSSIVLMVQVLKVRKWYFTLQDKGLVKL